MTGFRETIKSCIKSYKIIDFKILNHYKQPRIVNETVDQFTVIESFPSTSCCL